MNGYFEALMRSSGMTIDGRAAAAQQRGGLQAVSQDEPTLVQVNAEGSSQAVESTTARAAAPEQSAPVARPSMDGGARPLPVADTRDRQTAAPDVGAAGTQTPSVTEVTPHSRMTPLVQSLESSLGVRGDDLIRAAMRWVAADTHVSAVVQPDPPPLPAIQGGRVSLDVARSEPAIAPVAPRHDDDDAPAPPTSVMVTTPPIVGITDAAVPTARHRHAPDQARVPSITIAPPARDDVVEVSIGAIHVRVDAPAAHTLVTPAAMPSAGPRIAHTPPARSALSRRALRRI